ncbi:MAG: type II toxin-antitoxin system VapB family antitoxin [bacterium]
MKRTNIVLDEKVVEKAKKITGLRTQREVVDFALRELVRRNDVKGNILRLKGKIHWEGNLKEMRTGRVKT